MLDYPRFFCGYMQQPCSILNYLTCADDLFLHSGRTKSLIIRERMQPTCLRRPVQIGHFSIYAEVSCQMHCGVHFCYSITAPRT